jgi:hypothetical protein
LLARRSFKYAGFNVTTECGFTSPGAGGCATQDAEGLNDGQSMTFGEIKLNKPWPTAEIDWNRHSGFRAFSTLMAAPAAYVSQWGVG